MADSKKTILIVEDEGLLREVLRENLEETGARILEADSGEKALWLLGKEEVDLLVTDMHMPDGNGLELIEKLHQQNPKKIPVIFLSGDMGLELSQEEWLMRGVAAFFSKPFDLDSIVTEVKRLLS